MSTSLVFQTRIRESFHRCEAFLRPKSQLRRRIRNKEITLLTVYDVAQTHTGCCYFRPPCGCNPCSISHRPMPRSQIAVGRRLTSLLGPSTLEKALRCDPNFLHCSAYNLEAQAVSHPKPLWSQPLHDGSAASKVSSVWTL